MNKVAVVIETTRHHIYGHVAVPAVSRLSDYANEPQRRFWAVTDAEIAPLDDPERSRRVPFILVAAHEIGVISPIGDGGPVPAALVIAEEQALADQLLVRAAAAD